MLTSFSPITPTYQLIRLGIFYQMRYLTSFLFFFDLLRFVIQLFILNLKIIKFEECPNTIV